MTAREHGDRVRTLQQIEAYSSVALAMLGRLDLRMDGLALPEGMREDIERAYNAISELNSWAFRQGVGMMKEEDAKDSEKTVESPLEPKHLPFTQDSKIVISKFEDTAGDRPKRYAIIENKRKEESEFFYLEAKDVVLLNPRAWYE